MDSMIRRLCPLAIVPSLVSGLVLGLGGCRGEDISFDCENQKQNFLRQADSEVRPLQPIPEQGPYPVAMHLTEDGLNRLLASVIEEDVPFAGQVPFGLLPTGPGEADFRSESAPQLLLREVSGCPNCVIFSIDFSVGLTSQNEPLSTGAGFADLAVPLYLVPDPATGTTTLVAEYSEVEIDDWYLSVFGFDSETHEVVSGALQLLLEEEIAAEFGTVELLQLDSWNIGANEVKIVARELFVRPDLGRITLGMHTNLPMPSPGIDLEQELPEDIPMGIAFDTDIVLAMSYRMLEEGEIPRRYDEDGNPDPDGTYGVTLTTIEHQEATLNRLRTEFRVWRIAEGYCGFANVEMPLALSLNEQMSSIVVDAGDAVLIEGDNQGIGVAAEEERRLVDENQGLVDVFRTELSEQVGKTLNYEELDVEGSRILFTTEDIVVSEASINTYIDFLVFAEPEADGDTDGGTGE